MAPSLERRHVIAAAALCGVVLTSLALDVVLTAVFLRSAGNSGWLHSRGAGGVRVTQVRPQGPADGLLRRGDEIVAVDGIGVRRGFDIRAAMRGRHSGDSYRLLIRREERLLQLTLPVGSWGASFATFFILSLLPIKALFLVTGCAVLALKPRDPQAFLLSLMFALFAGGLGPMYPLASQPAWVIGLALGLQVPSNFFWAVFLHLFLVFPQPSPLLRRFPWLVRAAYLPAIGSLPLIVALTALAVVDTNAALATDGAALRVVSLAMGLAYALAGLLSLVLNYRQAGPGARRKLRVVVAGSLAGFLPLIVLYGVGFATDVASLGVWVSRVLITWFVLSLPLVPLSFAYAIVRHQVIPIRLMLRRSARYLVASRGYYLVEVAVLCAAIAFLLTGSRAAFLDRLGGRADVLGTVSVAAAVFGLLQLLNRKVTPWIDRRFFRDAYDAQRILAEMGEAARGAGSVQELLALAAERIGQALHPETIAAFLREDASNDYVCAFPQGETASVLSAAAPIVQRLRASPRPRETELGGVWVPIAAKGDLLGVLSLGPRLGDLPYSGEDRRLLQAVAWQVALAIENARLVQRRVEEERLRREIALASDVQRRLFPGRPPYSTRLDLAGLCQPAQGVGGDYYDFLTLGDGQLGIAVADVAGKGISAALLMSVVQATLRSQAGSVAPHALVAAMNQLLYRSAARNRYATFFYGQFDERTGRLTYVNAGHNPPLLLKGGALLPAAPLRLSTGGLIIGAFQGVVYEEAVVELVSGDILLAFTDGVTEAMDEDGDEFGEERLVRALAGHAQLAAPEMAAALLAEVGGFCGAAPQYDDVTLVVAKVR